MDNSGNNWDNHYILDEVDQYRYYFDEIHLTRNASLQMKTGDGANRTLDCYKLYGDRSGRIYMLSGHDAFLEEYQTQTKLPTNIWIDDGSKAYMSPMLYILGEGEIAFRWNGEIIYVRHLRIVPGRVIEIDSKAMTSYVEDDEYVQGTPGTFEFSTVEMGKNSILQLPPPMPLVLTAGILVSFKCVVIFSPTVHSSR